MRCFVCEKETEVGRIVPLENDRIRTTVFVCTPCFESAVAFRDKSVQRGC